MLKSNQPPNTLHYTTMPLDASIQLLPGTDKQIKTWLNANFLCIGVSIFAGFIIGIVIAVLIRFY